MGHWSWRFYIGRIRKAQRRGDIQRTVHLTRHYARFYPDDPNSWELLSVALMEAEDPEASLTAVAEGVRRFPLSVSMGRMHAKVLIANGLKAEARKVLERLRAQSPESPLPYLELTDLAFDEGEDDQAKSYLLKSLELAAETEWWTRMMLGKRLAGFAEERQAAIRVLRDCAERSENPYAQVALAAALSRSDPDGSREYAERARKVFGRGATVDVGDEVQDLSDWIFKDDDT